MMRTNDLSRYGGFALRECDLQRSDRSEKERDISTAMFTVVQVGIEVHGYDLWWNWPCLFGVVLGASIGL